MAVSALTTTTGREPQGANLFSLALETRHQIYSCLLPKNSQVEGRFIKWTLGSMAFLRVNKQIHAEASALMWSKCHLGITIGYNGVHLIGEMQGKRKFLFPDELQELGRRCCRWTRRVIIMVDLREFSRASFRSTCERDIASYHTDPPEVTATHFYEDAIYWRERVDRVVDKLLLAEELISVQVFLIKYGRNDALLQQVCQSLDRLTNVRDVVEICVVPSDKPWVENPLWRESKYVFKPGADVLALEKPHAAKAAWNQSVHRSHLAQI